MTTSELATLARLARRGARRNLRRTALIVALIAFTVAAAVVAAGVVRINDGELTALSDFGSADFRIGATYITPEMEEWLGVQLQDVADDNKMRSRSLYSNLRGGIFAGISDVDLSHPLAAGIAVLSAGLPPATTGEVALSERAADMLDVAVGESVDLEIGGSTPRAYRVTGLVRQPTAMRSVAAVLSPTGFDAAVAAAPPVAASGGGTSFTSNAVYSTWLVQGDPQLAAAIRSGWETDRSRFWPDPAVTPRPEALATLPDEVYVLLDADAVHDLAVLAPGLGSDTLEELAYARIGESADLPWVEVETREERLVNWETTDSALSAPPVLGTMVAALLLAEVAMVAAAAYATGTRRRLREIGLLGANGATHGHVRHIVVGEGIVAGLVGAGIGVAVALAALSIGRPTLQRFSDILLTGVPVEPVDIIGPVVAGVFATTLAAWVPARTASRVATVTALQGRMPVKPPRRWVPLAGLGLAALGALVVIVAKTSTGDGGAFLAGLGVVAMIAGTALCAGPLVAVLGGNADRTRATARLVLRDIARQRTRTTAAVAALMVVLVAPVTLAVAMGNEQVKQSIRGLPPAADHVVVNGVIDWESNTIPDAGAATPGDVARVQDIVGPSRATLFTTLDAGVLFAAEAVALPGVDRAEVDTPWDPRVARGTADLAHTLGDPRIAELLDAGRPVVLGVEERDTTVVLDGTTIGAAELPVAVAPWGMPRLLLPASLVDELGLQPVGTKGLVVAEDLTNAERDQLYRGDLYVVTGEPHSLTSTQLLFIALGVTLLVVLAIIALVTALSAAESDHDVTTMVAVGAPPSIRRRFLGLQTGFYCMLGGLLAAPLGWLLMKVVATGGDWMDIQPFGAIPGDIVTVPWATFAFVIVVVPLAVALLTAALTRSARTLPPRPTT